MNEQIFFKFIKSSQHIGEETMLRQFRRAKDDIIELAHDAGFDSAKLEYLLSLVGSRKQEDLEQINSDDDEVINSVFYNSYNIFQGSR